MRARTQVFALLILGGLGGGAARGDDASPVLEAAQKLTLEELFGAAVRAAPELQSAAFDAAVARANLTASRGIEDWNATIAVADAHTRNPASTDRAYNTSISLSRLLPTNGTFTFSATGSKIRHEEPRASNLFANLDLSVQLTQPVLANAGPAVERALIRASKHAWTAATIRRAAVAREFVADVVEAYWRLALAWRRLEVHQRSLDAAKKQYAAIQRGLATGAVAKSESLPFEQAIAARRIDLVTDEREIIRLSVDLRTLVGLEIPVAMPAVRTIEVPPPAPAPSDVQGLVAQAIATSDELKAALADVGVADAALEASRRNTMPSLDLTVKGDLTGVHRNFTNAFAELRENRGYQVSVGATFNLPIGRRRATGTYEAARADSARARFGLVALHREVTADVVRFATEARTNAQTFELSREVVALAQQNVEAEIKKFELGKSTSNDIVLRQTDLDNARLRLEEVGASTAISQVRLEALTGQILTHYGIRMIDPDKLTTDLLKER